MSMTLSINIAGAFSTILDPARQEQCNRNVMNMSTTKGVWKSSEICGLLKIWFKWHKGITRIRCTKKAARWKTAAFFAMPVLLGQDNGPLTGTRSQVLRCLLLEYRKLVTKFLKNFALFSVSDCIQNGYGWFSMRLDVFAFYTLFDLSSVLKTSLGIENGTARIPGSGPLFFCLFWVWQILRNNVQIGRSFLSFEIKGLESIFRSRAWQEMDGGSFAVRYKAESGELSSVIRSHPAHDGIAARVRGFFCRLGNKHAMES